jgi:hypothetical protein
MPAINHPWHQKGVVKDGGGVEILCHQPSYFKNVLVQPAFQLSQRVEQGGDQQPGGENF